MSGERALPTVLGEAPEAFEARTKQMILRGALCFLPVLALQLALLLTVRGGSRLLHELPALLLGMGYGAAVIFLADTVWGARVRLLRLVKSAGSREQEGTVTAVAEELSRSHGVWCRPLTLNTPEGEKRLLLPKDGVLRFQAGDRLHFKAEAGIIVAGEVTGREA